MADSEVNYYTFKKNLICDLSYGRLPSNSKMDSSGLLIFLVVFHYQFSTILGSELIPRQLFECLQLISGTQFQYVTLRNVPKVGFIYIFTISFSSSFTIQSSRFESSYSNYNLLAQMFIVGALLKSRNKLLS